MICSLCEAPWGGGRGHSALHASLQAQGSGWAFHAGGPDSWDWVQMGEVKTGCESRAPLGQQGIFSGSVEEEEQPSICQGPAEALGARSPSSRAEGLGRWVSERKSRLAEVLLQKTIKYNL